ncbi:MAG: hypothetical protein EOM28_08020 [Clostridia bacterium]|nr:hypothetical protein [Clostridia bacterium]
MNINDTSIVKIEIVVTTGEMCSVHFSLQAPRGFENDTPAIKRDGALRKTFKQPYFEIEVL